MLRHRRSVPIALANACCPSLGSLNAETLLRAKAEGLQFGNHALGLVLRPLLSQPINEFSDTVLKLHTWCIPEQFSRFGNVSKTVANISSSILACDFAEDLQPHGARKRRCDLANRNRRARSYVDCMAICLWRLHGKQICIDRVMNAHEVAQLASVFKDERCFQVEQPRGKDGSNSGIWVRERLPCPVDIEVAQRDNGQSIRPSVKETDFFLILFGERVNGRALQRFFFGRGHWSKFCATVRT